MSTRLKTGDAAIEIEDGHLLIDYRDAEQNDADYSEYFKLETVELWQKWYEEQVANDWQSLFHTRQEAELAPPIEFLIDGFLQKAAITLLGGPSAAMKTYSALESREGSGHW